MMHLKSKLNAKLNSIGKSIFVKYYYEFKDGSFDNQRMAQKLFDENPKASSVGAQSTRISNARGIFENKLHIDALENIVHSKVDSVTIENAKKLLREEKY